MKIDVTVDTRQVSAQRAAAERSLGRAGDDMKRILDRAASEERRTHEYRNQTYRLQGSTFALGPIQEGHNVVVGFGARMPYASFVDNRGLTRVRELADRAETEIDYRFDSEAERIGGM